MGESNVIINLATNIVCFFSIFRFIFVLKLNVREWECEEIFPVKGFHILIVIMKNDKEVEEEEKKGVLCLLKLYVYLEIPIKFSIKT